MLREYPVSDMISSIDNTDWAEAKSGSSSSIRLRLLEFSVITSSPVRVISVNRLRILPAGSSSGLMDAGPRLRNRLRDEEGKGAWLISVYSSRIELRSSPTPVISTSTVSPGFIHTGGSRKAPTPPGVPVAMISPGASGIISER